MGEAGETLHNAVATQRSKVSGRCVGATVGGELDALKRLQAETAAKEKAEILKAETLI